MKQYYILLFLFLTGLAGYAQTEEEPFRRGIAIITSPKKDSVQLRWAPNHHVLWRKANSHGYTLERFVLYRDGKRLAQPEHKLLVQGIKPREGAWWEKAMQDSLAPDYKWICIAAQSLYGEGFEITNDEGNEMIQIIRKTREQESRFSFALFSADQSQRVARAMGLQYTDREVKENEMYLYRVYPTQMTSQVDTGYVYTGPADYEPLQKPLGLDAKVDGHHVLVIWNQFLLSSVYNAYMVERSDDGGNTYRLLSESPIVLTYGEKGDIPMNLIKSDSIPHLGKEYYYRVYGITAFGEKGPKSDMVAVCGKPVYRLRYDQMEHTITPEGKVTLNWTLDSIGEQYAKNMEVLRATCAGGNYNSVSGILDGKVRCFTDSLPYSTNYYKIRATGVNEDHFYSLPVLVQLQDSIPPLPPVNLTGRIDTTGRVYISWSRGKEQDLQGYRVFRSNFLSDEFSQVTHTHTMDTVFTDSIDLYNLTPLIYYKVAAIDQRFNQSGLSEALKLEKPDTIPPVPPVFAGYQVSSKGIHLQWVHSSSVDTQKEILLRQESGSEDRTIVGEFLLADSINSHTDLKVERGQGYKYCLVAEDAKQNQSPAKRWLEVEMADNGFRSKLKGVTAEAQPLQGQVLLRWKRKADEVEHINIYRAQEGEALRYYCSVENKNSYKDTNVELNTQYQYRLQAVYRDGGKSPFTEVLRVHY
jgi:fibronectin type 3 domain-containing protein